MKTREQILGNNSMNKLNAKGSEKFTYVELNYNSEE